MSTRPGLSFELAPAPAADPLRTDIALFVGTVARRRVAVQEAKPLLPPVLQHWLQAQAVHDVLGLPLNRVRASLASPEAFIADVAPTIALQDRLAPAMLADAVRAAADDLIDACRTLVSPTAATVADLLHRGFRPAADDLVGWLRLQRLSNVPVEVDGFDAFAALFAWERRGVRDRIVRADDAVVATPLGIALRAFFGEGGARAWVVRSGDPSDVFDTAGGRFRACFPDDPEPDRAPQMPGVTGGFRRGLLADVVLDALPVALADADRVGIEHAYGLPEVSFVLLPDLIDACAQSVPGALPPAEVVAAPARFEDCVAAEPIAAQAPGRRLPPPRCNSLALEVWRRLVVHAGLLLANGGRAHHRRDVMLLASLPLVGDGRDLPPPDGWLAWMARTTGWMEPEDSLSSDRLQLAWPWIATADSADAQGGIEPPEGTLAGVLARNALARGAFRSASFLPLRRFQSAYPHLPWTQILERAEWTPLGELNLSQRLCLLGPAPKRPQLWSDVDCSPDPATRQAAVRRLVNVVIQAARRLGDDFAFDSNGELLWQRVRQRLGDLLRTLQAGGALIDHRVRCGRDTMSQADLDAGRLIVQIELQPAQPVQRIVVVLNLRDAGAAPQLAKAA
jgi:uncharacterized protein